MQKSSHYKKLLNHEILQPSTRWRDGSMNSTISSRTINKLGLCRIEEEM